MSGGRVIPQPHALEAIACDTVSFMSMFLSMLDHPHVALLSLGLLPLSSMYVVESHRALKELDPVVAGRLDEALATRLRPSRHRAKLLDDSRRSIEEVAGDMFEVAQRQTRLFMEPHVGVLGPLRRAIQPDLGLSTYNGHVFSTTHATAFSFGQDQDLGEESYPMGEALGEYVATLLGVLALQQPQPVRPEALGGAIEMTDIKSAALYRRGPLGGLPTQMAVGATLLLANLNYVQYVICRLLPADDHTRFKLKFIVAYHTDSNLRGIQNRLASTSAMTAEAASIFTEALGNADSRWLRKRTILRNVLVHYLVDERHAADVPPCADRMSVIEHFSGVLHYSDVDDLLDRHIARLSRTLEEGFDLGDQPFHYGLVT